MAKLYCVHIDNIFVVAEDQDQAEQVAARQLKDKMENGNLDFMCALRVKSASGIDSSDSEFVPIGNNPEGKTCREILAESPPC